MRDFLRAAALALAVLGTGPAWVGAEDPAAESPSLEDRLKLLDERFAAIEQVRGRFEQERATPMLRRPMSSSGTVLMKSGVIRWDTRKPESSTMVISSDEIRIYYPESEVLEVYSTEGSLGAAGGKGATPRLAALMERFRVEEVGVDRFGEEAADHLLGLELRPSDSAMADRVDHVLALIDTSGPMIRRVIVTSPDGEVTDLRLLEVRIGAEVTDREMELVVPEGTRISRPQGGVGSVGDVGS